MNEHERLEVEEEDRRIEEEVVEAKRRAERASHLHAIRTLLHGMADDDAYEMARALDEFQNLVGEPVPVGLRAFMAEAAQSLPRRLLKAWWGRDGGSVVKGRAPTE